MTVTITNENNIVKISLHDNRKENLSVGLASRTLRKIHFLILKIQVPILEVDGRRAGKVALKARASSSKPTIAQNDARHRLNKKQAQAQKSPVKFSW